jgi:hypothetical protein
MLPEDKKVIKKWNLYLEIAKEFEKTKDVSLLEHICIGATECEWCKIYNTKSNPSCAGCKIKTETDMRGCLGTPIILIYKIEEMIAEYSEYAINIPVEICITFRMLIEQMLDMIKRITAGDGN